MSENYRQTIIDYRQEMIAKQAITDKVCNYRQCRQSKGVSPPYTLLRRASPSLLVYSTVFGLLGCIVKEEEISKSLSLPLSCTGKVG